MKKKIYFKKSVLSLDYEEIVDFVDYYDILEEYNIKTFTSNHNYNKNSLIEIFKHDVNNIPLLNKKLNILDKNMIKLLQQKKNFFTDKINHYKTKILNLKKSNNNSYLNKKIKIYNERLNDFNEIVKTINNDLLLVCFNLRNEIFLKLKELNIEDKHDIFFKFNYELFTNFYNKEEFDNLISKIDRNNFIKKYNESKVLIIMPTYNRSKNIINILQMIDKQTFKNYNLLIIDDGSNKENKDLFYKIKNSNEYNSNFIFMENKTNQHVAKTLNRGIDFF